MSIARRRSGFGGFARPSGEGQTTPVTPEFVTVPSDLPACIVGRPYFHQFQWVGRPEPIFEVVGYPGVQYTDRGAMFIPYIAEAGSFAMEARLRESLDDTVGEVIDTVEWTLVASEPQQLTDAVINSSSLAEVLYGDNNPLVPLDVSGSEPYVLSLESGSLPSGLGLRVGSFTRAELLVSCIEGEADLEGAGFSCGIAVTGATGVKSATKTFAGGITVNRPPTFVGLVSIPQLPSNTPGALDLAPFIRAYPPITGFTADPVLTTLHANLDKSGLTITYGDLTTIAGTQTAPVLFTLDDSGIGTPDTLTSVIEVGASSVPVPKVLVAYDFSAYSGANGSEITVVPDLAQGLGVPMSTDLKIAGTTGPTFNSSAKCAQFRAGKSIGIPITADLYPFAIGLSCDFKSTTGSGTKEFLRSTGTFAYFDKGVAGGSAPVYTESTPFTKTGSRSSDTFQVTPSEVAAAVVVKIGHGRNSADIISSMSMSNGGAPVSLSRATAAADTNNKPVRTYIYFRGNSIPTGELTFTVNYSGSIMDPVYFVVETYEATADVEIVSTPTPIQANTANPSLTFDTTVSNLDCLATAMLGSGQQTLASITDGGTQTRQHTFTYDADVDGTVSYGAGTRFNRTGTADPQTVPVPDPGFTPRGVFMVAWGGTTTDEINAMTYGGVNVPVVYTAADATSSFTRRLIVGFVGAGLSGGAQDAVFDFTSATGIDYELLVVPINGSGDLEIVDSDGINADAVTNASVTLQYNGRRCQAISFGMWGLPDVGDAAENASLSIVQEIDKGASIWLTHKQTTPGTSDFSVSYTNASTAVFLRAFAVSEVENARDTNFVASRQTTASTSDATISHTISSLDCAMCGITMSEMQGSGAVLSLANNGLYSTGVQSGVIDTRVRHILYASSATTGSYWKNGVKSAMSGSAGNIAGRLNNIIPHGQQCDWDLYKIEIWKGTLSDGDATAMDTRLNTDVTPPTPPPPNPPTNTVASGGNTVIDLSWTPALGAISTKIERSTTGVGVGFAEIADETDANYRDTGRTNGVQYFYRFRSVGIGGNSAYSAEIIATPQAPVVGAPQNNRITNISSGTITHAWDAVTGASYKVYRGTAQGGPYTLIASGVTALSYQHPSLPNGTPHYFVVKATISGVDSANSNEVSATPQAGTGITKTFPLFSGLFTADIPLSQHSPVLKFEASGPSVKGRAINSPTTGGGSDTAGHLAAGFPFVKKVSKLVPHLGANRNFFEMTIWDSDADTFLYTANNSSTVRASISVGGYDTEVGLQEQWFYAFAFMIDPSLLEANPLLGGFDHGFLGLHHDVTVSHPGLTPMSLFLDPVDSTEMRMRITVRRHPFDNAQVGEQQYEEKGAEISGIVPDRLYEVVYEWKLGFWNVHGGYARAWMWENGVARNAGKPFLDYSGRVGYNIQGFRHQRRIMSHYLWRGKSQFTQLSANNISNIPSGAKGLRYWVRKSLACAGGTSGGITVTRDTMLNYLRLVE